GFGGELGIDSGGLIRTPHPHPEHPKDGRYNAACAAAPAGCGQGEDADQLDEQERAPWRRQALDWLRADLAHWTKAVENDTPPTRAALPGTLRHWQRDPDLAGLRDAAALAELPEEEREAWRGPWAEVKEALTRADR